MNVLITGAQGFVGTNLAISFKRESLHQLLFLSTHKPLGQKKLDCDFYTWDELNSINKAHIDAIIHLAGKAHDTKDATEEQIYFDVNVGLTKKIFDFFLQSNAKKFVFFSSVKAVADSVKKEWLTEDEEPIPSTPYGRSKLAAEKYLDNKLNDFLAKEYDISMNAKHVYILRPCMIHGPGNKGNLNLLYNMVAKGIPWPLGAFENKRSFTSIDNLSFVIKKILNDDIEAGIYNIADDLPLSTNHIIKLIAEIKGEKASILKLNKKIISLIAKFGDKIALPLNSERLKKLTESYMVSNAKLKKQLGVENMPLSAEEGIKITLKSFDKL